MMLKKILDYMKKKEAIIKTGLKAFLAAIPGAILFFLSYTHPALLSFSLVWQIALPIITALTCLLSGYEYFLGGIRSFKTILVSIYQSLIQRKSTDKDKSKDKAEVSKEHSISSILANLDMNVLVALSMVSSAIYVAFLGMAAPIVIYAAPLLTLTALQLSKLLKNLITQWVNKSAQIKLDLLRQKYKDLKDEIQKTRKGAIITLTPNAQSGFKTFIPVNAKLLSLKAEVSGGTYLTGEKEKITHYEFEQIIPGGTYYVGKEPIILEADCDGLQSHNYKLVEELLNRSQSVSFTDKLINIISACFVPVVLSISVLSFIAWSIASGPAYGFTVLLDILFAACPCALGIAAAGPISLLKAVLFNKNIALHNEKVITELPEFDTIVFDKTGTLTQLQFNKINFRSEAESQRETHTFILGCIAHAEKVRLKIRPSDSFALAISRSEVFSKIVLPQEIKKQLLVDSSNNEGLVVSFTEANTFGISKVYIGSIRYMESLGLAVDTFPKQSCSDDSSTKVYIAVEKDGIKSPVSTVSFAQKLREDAEDTITNLKNNGVAVYMLTGDNYEAAKAVAKDAGISLDDNYDNIQAECTVIGERSKAAYVKKLIAEKRKVLVVGDGWNDLDAANSANAGSIAMGIHSDMGGRFDVTIEELSDILKLKPIFKSVQLIQQQVFAFSILYNLLAIFLAAVIFPMAGMVTMMGCFGICMAFSSLFAIAWSSLIVPLAYKDLINKKQEAVSALPVVNPESIYMAIPSPKASCSLPSQLHIPEYQICNPVPPIGSKDSDLHSLSLRMIITGRCAGCEHPLNICTSNLAQMISAKLSEDRRNIPGTDDFRPVHNVKSTGCGNFEVYVSFPKFFCGDTAMLKKDIEGFICRAGFEKYNPCGKPEISDYYSDKVQLKPAA